MDYSLTDSSVHGIFQARIWEWVAISYSGKACRPRDQTCVSCVSCTGRQILYHCVTWEASLSLIYIYMFSMYIYIYTHTYEKNILSLH